MSKITYYEDEKDMTGNTTDIATRIEIENGVTRIYRYDHFLKETNQPVYVDTRSQIKVEGNKTIILLYRDE